MIFFYFVTVTRRKKTLKETKIRTFDFRLLGFKNLKTYYSDFLRFLGFLKLKT